MIKFAGKVSYWLIFLVSMPVLEAREIIEDPQNMTVCLGEAATFTSVIDIKAPTTDFIMLDWFVNNSLSWELPDDIRSTLSVTKSSTDMVIHRLTITFPSGTGFSEFNNTKIRSYVSQGGISAISAPAYLIYKSNPQFSVANLTIIYGLLNPEVFWESAEPRDNKTCYRHLIRFDQQEIFQTSNRFYQLPNATCQFYEVRVTAVEVLYPECNDTKQTTFSAIDYYKPDIAPVLVQFEDKKIYVSWTPADNSSHHIVIRDTGNLIHQADVDDPPPYVFPYEPEYCGDFHLSVTVTPSICSTSFYTREASRHFYTLCPDNVTDALPPKPDWGRAIAIGFAGGVGTVAITSVSAALVWLVKSYLVPAWEWSRTLRASGF